MRLPAIPRTALVTGSSTGIGLATARFLAAHGWHVVPTARKPADLERLRGERFDAVHLDLEDPDSIRIAAEEGTRILGAPPGALVNNAGMGQPGAVEDLGRAALRRQFEINVFGLQELTNRFIPGFRDRGSGRIVNISSVLGRIVLPSMGAYCASKFALTALSHALRIELRGSGIGVSLVEPGPIDTAFSRNAIETARRELNPSTSVFAAAYRHQLGEVTGGASMNDRFRKPPEAVARVVYHALTSRCPRRRYRVTLPAHAGALLSRLAPDGLLDRLLWRRMIARYGIR